MSCLVPFMEEQIAMLQKQLKDTAFSHDAKANEIIMLKAEVKALELKLYPPPPEMTGRVLAEGETVEDDGQPAEEAEKPAT